MNVWSEKWNYEACFLGEASLEEREFFKNAMVRKIDGLNPLPWNILEENIIRKLIEHFYRFLSTLGLEPIKIHDEQIVILDEDEYRFKIDPEDGGCYLNGYIYVFRSENISVFTRYLAHEIAHLLSFYSLDIGEKSVSISQVGYFRAIDSSHFYSGLNEAVTDLCSWIILKNLLNSDLKILKNMEDGLVFDSFVYPYQVSLLGWILSSIEDETLLDSLFKSYFDGSDSFLKSLEEEDLLAYEVLKTMTGSDSSALEAIEVIGGSKLVEEIKKSYVEL